MSDNGYAGLLAVANGWKARAVAAEAERDALAAHVERMSKAALDAIHYLPGGEIKAELRDAYDATPETSLARLKAEWDEKELRPIWETLIKVADILGIDPEASRKVPGKPSDVYAAHLAHLKAEWQAEAISRYAYHHLGGHEQELAEIYAGKLRRQSEEPTDGHKAD